MIAVKKIGRRSRKAVASAFVVVWLSLIVQPVQSGEAELFLNQFPNTTLATLDMRYRGSQGMPPNIISYDRPGAGSGRWVSVGGSSGASHQRKFNRSLGGKTIHQTSSQKNRIRNHWPWKRFVVFSRCVVRSFYIWRFQQNDLGDDPIGLGDLPDDPLCPKPPEYYLEKATRFSEWFFGV